MEKRVGYAPGHWQMEGLGIWSCSKKLRWDIWKSFLPKWKGTAPIENLRRIPLKVRAISAKINY